MQAFWVSGHLLALGCPLPRNNRHLSFGQPSCLPSKRAEPSTPARSAAGSVFIPGRKLTDPLSPHQTARPQIDNHPRGRRIHLCISCSSRDTPQQSTREPPPGASMPSQLCGSITGIDALQRFSLEGAHRLRVRSSQLASWLKASSRAAGGGNRKLVSWLNLQTTTAVGGDCCVAGSGSASGRGSRGSGPWTMVIPLFRRE